MVQDNQNNDDVIFPDTYPPVGEETHEVPSIPRASRFPLWMFYIVLALVLAIAYAVYLQKQITNFDNKTKSLEREVKRLENDITFMSNASNIEKQQALNEIDTLKTKLSNAERSLNSALDKANKDAIVRIEQEREYWRSELDRVISYYQKQFKTPKTPPPPSKQ